MIPKSLLKQTKGGIHIAPETLGHEYKIILQDDGSYDVVMIISNHKSLDEAVEAMLNTMKKESKEILEKEVEELRKQGIEAVTFEEAIKNMTPEELERFLEERKRKFFMPMIDKNIEYIKQKSKRSKIIPLNKYKIEMF